MRILLAEDNIINQKVATRMLARLGYQADVANNGLEALEAIQRQPYDVILMDVQMPEMGGLEATVAIRALTSRVKQPWIIAMTADIMQDTTDGCISAGMDDFISKPTTLDILEATLKKASASVQTSSKLP